MDGGGGAAAHLCGAYGLRACGKPCAAVCGMTKEKNNFMVCADAARAAAKSRKRIFTGYFGQ